MSIKVSQAFERTSAQPIDTSLALTKAEMLAVNDNLMPAYYFTICQDDGKIYLYDKSATPSVTTGKFTEFSGGGGGSSDVKFFTTTDTLSKDINGTKVVAAADLPGVTWSDLVVGSSVIKDAKGTMGLVTTITGTTSVTVTTATTSTPTVELTQAQYDALATKDPDTIYFITDSYVPSTYMGAYDTIYSTTERVVGSYMGKPLYQKSFVLDKSEFTKISDYRYEYSISSLNIDKLVKADSVASVATDGQGVSPGIVFTNNSINNSWNYGVLVHSSKIVMSLQADVVSYGGFSSVTATLQYTKTTDTASAVEYASPNDYSTSEKIVGTWIDGKPLYQKTVVVGSVAASSADEITFSHGISNIDDVIDFDAYVQQDTDGTNYPLPYFATNGNVALFIRRVTSSQIVYMNNSNWTDCTFYVTVKYTKTSS